MRVAQVAAFLTTARTGSFASAGAQLQVRRSTVSAAVQALEDELGVQLFSRSGNSLTITPAGQALLADSQRLVQSARRIQELSAQHLEGIETELKIARDDALPETFWHQCMDDLQQHFPQTSTAVYLVPSQEHPDFIHQGIVDVAFGLHDKVAPDAQLALVDQRLVVHPEHPLTRLPRVTTADLAQYRQICLTFLQDRQLIVKDQIARQYLGLTMYEVMRDAVLRGDGWAILPTSLIHSNMQNSELVGLTTDAAISPTYFQFLTRDKTQAVATWLKNRVLTGLTTA